MDDIVVFQFLQDTAIPKTVKRELKIAFESFDEERVEKIIEEILLIKNTEVLLKLKH